MNKKDGVPAFPVDGFITNQDRGGHNYQIELSGGMTLRDYFAAKAMAGMVSTVAYLDGRLDEGRVSEWSYLVADAMLAEREK